MTKEDKEILRNLWVMTTDHVLDEENKKLKQAISNVLNELETYKHYYEELTTGLNNSSNRVTDLTRENTQLRYQLFNANKQLEEKDKIIDVMARMINSHDIDEDICKQMGKNKNCDKYTDNTNRINCIKQYFERNIGVKNE